MPPPRRTTSIVKEYTSSVTSHIRKCGDDMVITKTIKSFPNEKVEVSGETVERPQDHRYVAGNPDHHRLQKQESPPPPYMCEAMLPHELNNFHARFDLFNKESAFKYDLFPKGRPLSVSTADVRRSLLKVNVSKAAGSDNIPGRVLRACANQPMSFLTFCAFFTTYIHASMLHQCCFRAFWLKIHKFL